MSTQPPLDISSQSIWATARPKSSGNEPELAAPSAEYNTPSVVDATKARPNPGDKPKEQIW